MADHCRFCGLQPVVMPLPIQADRSHTGQRRMEACPIDACIAGLVQALNGAGIETRGSCCGHGDGDGSIMLEDGRELVIRGGERSMPTLDEAHEGIMLTYTEQDFPNSTPYQRTIPGWRCRKCGLRIGTSGLPPNPCKCGQRYTLDDGEKRDA